VGKKNLFLIKDMGNFIEKKYKKGSNSTECSMAKDVHIIPKPIGRSISVK
jgi:hypothetical protein